MSRVVGGLLVALSLILLGDVLSGLLFSPQPPPTDEETQAHIFQITVALLVPTMLAAVLIWGGRSPTLRNAWPLYLAAAALIFSFGGVYYLEHH